MHIKDKEYDYNNLSFEALKELHKIEVRDNRSREDQEVRLNRFINHLLKDNELRDRRLQYFEDKDRREREDDSSPSPY